jgi:phage terminase large subunit-like protein
MSLQTASESYDEMTDEELAKYIRSLSPESRKRISTRVRTRMSEERQVWFCGDRQCDGKPHGAYNYKHARGSKREDSRGSQYPPVGTDWYTWMLGAGRGSGKTKTGSEYSRYISKHIPYIALIGPTGPTTRAIMIDGPSGLIKACERAGEYEPGMYEPSKSRFTFQNGCIASIFSAEEPARIRGGNFGFFWADEPAHWDDPQAAWDQALFANRVGRRPHALATTTPLPNEFTKKLKDEDDTVYVGGSTYDNIENLAEAVVRKILKKYEGTYLGRQEIHGEIIDDREGALWNSEMFAETDFYFEPGSVELERVLVGIDPAGSNNKRSDLTGIIVGGSRGDVIHALDDFSGKFSPEGWAQKAIHAYEKYKADAIVVEKNYGGEMCRATLRAAKFKGRIIEAQATDSKRVRAEPISALYEQLLGRHVRGGAVANLESELVSWVPGESKSPNRLDAWVWVATQLTKHRGTADMSDPTEGASEPAVPVRDMRGRVPRAMIGRTMPWQRR